MPELPEVETIVRGLARPLTGRKLRRPTLFKPDVLRGVRPAVFLDRIRNRTVAGVTRRAKHIVIQLDDGLRMVVQLRMTGNLLFTQTPLRGKAHKYVVFRAGLGAGQSLVFRDVRRLGTISLLNETQWRSYTDRLGPEPLDADFDLAGFGKRLAGTRQAIKKAIMDQQRLAGVGNIYANEALFRAGIDPSRRADCLHTAEIARLIDAVQTILGEAVDAGGTTLRDYRGADGEPGSFQGALRVYGRAGQPCTNCRTALVTTQEIDGRQTVLCWKCQR